MASAAAAARVRTPNVRTTSLTDLDANAPPPKKQKAHKKATSTNMGTVEHQGKEQDIQEVEEEQLEKDEGDQREHLQEPTAAAPETNKPVEGEVLKSPKKKGGRPSKELPFLKATQEPAMRVDDQKGLYRFTDGLILKGNDQTVMHTLNVGTVVELSLPKKAVEPKSFVIGLIFRSYNAGLWRIMCFELDGQNIVPEQVNVPVVNIMNVKAGVAYNKEELASLTKKTKSALVEPPAPVPAPPQLRPIKSKRARSPSPEAPRRAPSGDWRSVDFAPHLTALARRVDELAQVTNDLRQLHTQHLALWDALSKRNEQLFNTALTLLQPRSSHLDLNGHGGVLPRSSTNN